MFVALSSREEKKNAREHRLHSSSVSRRKTTTKNHHRRDRRSVREGLRTVFRTGNRVRTSCLVFTLLLSNQCTQTDRDLSSTTSRIQSIFSRFLPRRKVLVRRHRSSTKRTELYPSSRPYFTYWVTFVQSLVCIVSLIVYGYAPFTSTQSVSVRFVPSAISPTPLVSLEQRLSARKAATLRPDDEPVVRSPSCRSDSSRRQVHALHASA